jgi:hypothetical protein
MSATAEKRHIDPISFSRSFESSLGAVFFLGAMGLQIYEHIHAWPVQMRDLVLAGI